MRDLEEQSCAHDPAHTKHWATARSRCVAYFARTTLHWKGDESGRSSARLLAVEPTTWALAVQTAAACFTAAAAVAAWVSALASRRTSRDALAALAVGIRPDLRLDALRGGDPPRDELIVRNDGEWDALNVDVDILLRDGRTISDGRGTLRPLVTRTGEPTGDLFTIDLGRPEEPAPSDRFRRVIVTFTDSRRIATYRLEEEHLDVEPFLRRTETQIAGP
jgi:hypothetical protein